MAMVGTILSYVPLVLILGLVTVVHRLGHVALVRAVYRADEEGQDLDFSFASTSVWARFAIVLAGPAANFLLAVLLFWGLLTFVGGSALPLMGATVGQVIQGSPAAQGGIRGRDRIVAVDGEPVGTWEELARQTRPRTGQVVRLTVEREAERFEVIMTTRASSQHRVVERTGTLQAIGITRAESGVSDRLHPLTALVESGKRTAATIAMVLKGLGRVMVGSASPQTIGSSILLDQMTGVQIQRESLIPL
ncbi:MAG: site-2 protease family protein, partial [Candidatus Methylomirabilales bacterium]